MYKHFNFFAKHSSTCRKPVLSYQHQGAQQQQLAQALEQNPQNLNKEIK